MLAESQCVCCCRCNVCVCVCVCVGRDEKPSLARKLGRIREPFGFPYMRAQRRLRREVWPSLANVHVREPLIMGHTCACMHANTRWQRAQNAHTHRLTLRAHWGTRNENYTLDLRTCKANTAAAAAAQLEENRAEKIAIIVDSLARFFLGFSSSSFCARLSARSVTHTQLTFNSTNTLLLSQ